MIRKVKTYLSSNDVIMVLTKLLFLFKYFQVVSKLKKNVDQGYNIIYNKIYNIGIK